VELNTE
jgi:hypothetical protein